MRILFLDDMKARHDAFRKNTIGHDVVFVFTAKEAIEALDTQGRFDQARLDHDLEETHYAAGMGVAMCHSPICPLYPGQEHVRERGCPGGLYGSGTGMDVIDHIIAMAPEKRPRKIISHTFNTERGKEMIRRLRDVGIRDCYWYKFDPRIGV